MSVPIWLLTVLVICAVIGVGLVLALTFGEGIVKRYDQKRGRQRWELK